MISLFLPLYNGHYGSRENINIHQHILQFIIYILGGKKKNIKKSIIDLKISFNSTFNQIFGKTIIGLVIPVFLILIGRTTSFSSGI